MKIIEPRKSTKKKKIRGCPAGAFVVLLFFLFLPLGAEDNLRFKGEYFLFSDDHNYLYGGGNISLKGAGMSITGDVLYMDVARLTGIIYGDVRIIKGDGKKGKKEEKWDAVLFRGVPPQWLMVSYEDEMITKGDRKLKPLFMSFEKKAPEALKNSSLYFEFREFRINKNRKIKAKIVIPYMMGLPTVPLKRFTVNRGEWAEKTMLAFNNINYTGLDGLSLAFFFRLRGKFIKGDYDLKLYERALFKLDGVKRGALVSGRSSLFIKKKELLNYSALLNSGDKSFNLRLNHRQDGKYFSYSLVQNISGREHQPTFLEFSSDVTIKPLKIIIPTFGFTHDFKKSVSYRVSTPVNLWKKLNLNVSWRRKIIKDNYRSDTSDFSTSLSFNASLFSLSSNYNFSKNLVAASIRKNFTVNLNLKPLRFLEDNVAIYIATFYMFSEVPYGDETQKRTSPGLNVTVNSIGVALPLRFELVPSFTFNHLWDNTQEDFTDFNYVLALQKRMGIFSASLAYSLASRYRARDFWIEGSSRKNMNLNLELKHRDEYALLMRFYFNNSMARENNSFTGALKLPFDFTLSSFILYYNNEERPFQTLEVFIEKIFKNKIRLQGGYSLALKRFFIKFLTI
jgi:hypothetical protein